MSADTADVVGGQLVLDFIEVCIALMHDDRVLHTGCQETRWHTTAILPEVIKRRYTNHEMNMIAAVVNFRADLPFYYNRSGRSVMGLDVTPTGHAALPDGGVRETLRDTIQ